MTLFGWMPAASVFVLSLYAQAGRSERWSRTLRKQADLVYVIHPWVIFGCIRALGLHDLPLGATAIGLSAAASAACMALLRLRRTEPAPR